MKPKRKLGEMLLESGLIGEERLTQALDANRGSDVKLGQYLIRQGLISESQLVDLVSRQLNIQRYDPDKYPVDYTLAGFIPPEAARKHHLVPLEYRGNLLTVGLNDPLNIMTLDTIEALTNAEVDPVICTEDELSRLFDRLYGPTTKEKWAIESKDYGASALRLFKYFKILNFTREPFSNSPDPDFFSQFREHLECLQKIDLCIRERRGLSVVMGEVGTGKTTLCRQLIRRLARDEKMKTHLILDPYFSSPREFLSAVSKMFGGFQPHKGTPEWQLREHIKRYLFHSVVEEEKTIVLIIDEAQELPGFCLEILREFLNYESNAYKLLQIVIFAQNEFGDILENHDDLADRISSLHILSPLSLKETGAMIRFRLELASEKEKHPIFFSYFALWAIYRATGGYPRKIISLCHRIILAMIVQNRSRAGWFLVRSCAKRSPRKPSGIWPRAAVAVLSGIAGVLLVTGFLYERSDLPVVSKLDLTGSNAGTHKTRLYEITPAKRLPPPVQVHHNQRPAAILPGAGNKTPEAVDTGISSIPLKSMKPEGDMDAFSPSATSRMVELQEIRGAGHGEYCRVVFQFRERPVLEKPVTMGREVLINLKNVTTRLAQFRAYKSFHGSVRLEQRGPNLLARVRLLKGFKRLRCFRMKNPYRLVVDLYV